MTSPAADDRVVLEVRPLEHRGAFVALVTLNRPDQLNAIDWDMVRALNTVVDGISDRREIRAVLITGAGRAFSAGGDLKTYVTLQRDPVRFPEFTADLHRTFGRLRRLRVPVLALVNGVAAAGGLELLLSCDIAFAAASARIGDAHVNYGQMGGGGALTLLPRLVGLQHACELVFSGALLDAQEAWRWGLVSRCVSDDALLDAGIDFAEQVAAKSALAVANAKEVMVSLWSERVPLDAGLRYELERNAYYCLTSQDAREGLQAFVEKRAPRFEGR